ncbi:tyrosine-type recombinase/integrase [Bradyrhizobium sp. AUGA SZCCT0177]|uniref:tyrosine-type recombinase/integrase n=1 Tax=Bradyrhizobium sp. AUGA SZCCT0177 TaxID=2807665 RepID=UPI001BAAE89D|nr:tyrosine-type recombinase/integrase [Bradyrhizobium sp. AUGA SZCCT0177]MBR1286811.1 tyrosine-type recombinase/integrase [Bradyrhizobium sp. AUGA SZCCT0177]
MAKIKLKYVNEYIDHTGKLRRYFRKRGKQLGTLPGEVGSEEFMTAYAAFLAAEPAIAKRPVHEDSLAKLIIDFYGSRLFTDRKPSTRQLYRYALDPISKEHGHRSATLMTAENAEKIINKIGATKPGMGNLTRAVMRRVFYFAVKTKRRKDNPVLGIDAFKVGEHHTWTDAELRQYEAKWRLGTRQRLAYAFLLYTGQRVGDVAKMNRADVADGLIHVVQQKTGAELWVPIHPELARAMKSYSAQGLSLIGDGSGRPLKRAALSSLMRLAIKQAGLPSRCVSHGLRKAAMRRMAENDATANQIASISGHKTLKEVERYTKAADQKKMARVAMGKVPNEKS